MLQGEGQDEFEAEGSEASFVSAVSHAAPAGSVASDADFASLMDEFPDDFDLQSATSVVHYLSTCVQKKKLFRFEYSPRALLLIGSGCKLQPQLFNYLPQLC